MSSRFCVVFLLPVLCLAQTPDGVTTRQVLEELKGMRASLERLEKGQRALLALIRLQADESRVTALEGQRLQLSTREQSLRKDVEAAGLSVNAPPLMVMNPDGSTAPAPPVDDGPARARLAQVTSSLKEVEQARQTLDRDIARLKERIAAVEKYIEDVLR